MGTAKPMTKADVKTSLKNQIEDIKKTSQVSSLILSCCMIDTLAGFYCGYEGQRGRNKAFYVEFAKKYLSTYNAEKLYTLRCDVVHSFSNTLSYWLVESDDLFRAFPHMKGLLGDEIFNISKLKTDVETAFENYFTDLDTDSALELNFNKRLAYIGLVKKTVIPTMTDINGKIIGNHEDMPELPGTGLKYGYYNPTIINK